MQYDTYYKKLKDIQYIHRLKSSIFNLILTEEN